MSIARSRGRSRPVTIASAVAIAVVVALGLGIVGSPLGVGVATGDAVAGGGTDTATAAVATGQAGDGIGAGIETETSSGTESTLEPSLEPNRGVDTVTASSVVPTRTTAPTPAAADAWDELRNLRVEYAPSTQTLHVGLFSLLTVVLGALGCWIRATRRTRGGRVFALTLLATALRTASDVAHGVIGDLWTLQSAMVAANLVLELWILLSFLWFASRYADEERLTGRRGTRALLAIGMLGTVLVLTNPAHSLAFAEFAHEPAPFAHVTGELGPLGWLVVAVQVGSLLAGAGVLARTFTVTESPAWWAAATLSMAICLALVIGGLSALERGPLPLLGYDYAAVGLAGFVLLTATTVLAHGLRRIEITARESVLEDLEDAIVVLDDAHGVVDSNAAARTLIPGLERGTRFDELLEEPPAVPAAGGTTTVEVSSASLGARADEDGDEKEDENGNGTTASGDAIELTYRDEHDYYLLQTSSVTTETNDVIGYTVRFVDVTDLKRRTAELTRKNEQLDQFASTVTHDLRNPLTVATGYVDLLDDTVEEGETDSLERSTLVTYLEPVESSLERMRTIIDDILALARNESVTDPRPVGFESVVGSAWRSVDTGGATLAVTGGGTLEADRDRLQRLLENLFRNAVEHAGPEVSIVAGVTDDGFYVADDGPGIPVDARDRIFEHGYSGDAAGTGLGLAIVERLATAHGWRVRLDPAHDGARFVFTGCTVLETEQCDGIGDRSPTENRRDDRL